MTDTLSRRLTLTEVADLEQVSPRTVRRWIAAGYLNASRVGPRSVRIDPDDLAAFRASNRMIGLAR